MLKHFKTCFVLFLAAALCLGGTAAAGFVGAEPWPVPENKASSAYFADVSGEWNWAAGSVDQLYEKGIVGGIDGAFQPQDAIWRGDLLLLIFRALALEPAAETAETPFRDVPAGSPYAAAVTAAWEMGIVTGEDGLFRPYDSITREEAFTLLHRAALAVGAQELDAGGSLVMFSDSLQLEPYARNATANLVREGLVQGDGLLRPKDGISRAEAAVLVCRLMYTDLTGRESVKDAALSAAGLSRAELDSLTKLLRADAAAAQLGGTGYLEVRPFYLERLGPDRARIYASIYFSGSYWCTVRSEVQRGPDGPALVEPLYSFG